MRLKTRARYPMSEFYMAKMQSAINKIPIFADEKGTYFGLISSKRSPFQVLSV